MTTTPDTTTKLTNKFGTPFRIQSLAEWTAYVGNVKNDLGLARVRKELNTGNSLFASVHPFAHGSEDYFAAHRVLKEHALELGWEWHRGYGKYLEIDKKS